MSAIPTGAQPAAYLQLAELAEAELALVEEGRHDELEPLHEQGRALVASLPERAPAEARPALERAIEAQERIARRLAVNLAETRSELDRLRRGRDAARSYGATAAARGGP